jgi:hypothetical protein
MVQSNRNFIIAYILLVGLPVLGLVGVLKTGRRIAGPISLDGTWTLQADSSRLASLPCGKSLTSSDFSISQSGETFTLSITTGPKSTASGVLVGTTLKASLFPSLSDDPDCGRGRELNLLATVDPNATPRSLTGTISLNDCPTCKPVEFRAFRRPPAAKGGS